MLRPLVLLLLEVNLVTAFRDGQALAHQKGTICFGSCCRPKCSGQSYSLKAESKGEWKFHDCKVRRNGGAKWFHGYGRTCIEDCTVLHSKEPQEAIVMRRSGRGSSPQCELYYQDLTLQEFAMDFVEQLETALTLTNGNYGDLPLMKAGKVLSFLEKVEKKVLKPEFDQQRYSQEIKSNTVAIIGDLHGQLFNLIGFMLVIKDKYKDKGFSMLEGSSLLFCDPGMQYVFLGDYVDRGERGVEVLLLLLAYKASGGQTRTKLGASARDMPCIIGHKGWGSPLLGTRCADKCAQPNRGAGLIKFLASRKLPQLQPLRRRNSKAKLK